MCIYTYICIYICKYIFIVISPVNLFEKSHSTNQTKYLIFDLDYLFKKNTFYQINSDKVLLKLILIDYYILIGKQI